jgi:hypothetical protein
MLWTRSFQFTIHAPLPFTIFNLCFVLQGHAPDAAVRKITQSVMVAWGELATKLPPLPRTSGRHAEAPAPWHQEARPSAEPFLRGNNSGRMPSEAVSFSSHTRMTLLREDVDNAGLHGATCSLAGTSGSESSFGASRNVSRQLFDSTSTVESGGPHSVGEWMSESVSFSEQSMRASQPAYGGSTERVEGLWREVAQGVSKQAEEILKQSASGTTGRPLEVRYRVKPV